MKCINLNKKSGFSILAVILVIVTVTVAIGIWAMSGQTNTSNLSNSSTDIVIEGLINDAAAIKSSVEVFKLQNGKNAKLDTGLFIFEKPPVNPKLIRSGATEYEGKWTINPNNFYASYVGDVSIPDITILVGGIPDDICKKINNKLHGTPTLPSVSSGTSSSSLVSSFPNGFAYNYMYLPSVAGVYGWSKGCFNVKNLPDNNVFFFVAMPY